RLDAMLVAIFGLTLNYGAYGAEAVRASLTSVPQGQWEATVALSMSWPHKIRRIIFPQAWALMLPSLTNLWVHLLKGSSIVYLVGLSEFTFELLQLRRTTDWFFSLAVVGLIVYFLMGSNRCTIYVLASQNSADYLSPSVGANAPFADELVGAPAQRQFDCLSGRIE